LGVLNIKKKEKTRGESRPRQKQDRTILKTKARAFVKEESRGAGELLRVEFRLVNMIWFVRGSQGAKPWQSKRKSCPAREEEMI